MLALFRMNPWLSSISIRNNVKVDILESKASESYTRLFLERGSLTLYTLKLLLYILNNKH